MKKMRMKQKSKNIIFFFNRVVHPISGRYLEVYSNQEGVQLYTTNFLPDPCGNVRLSIFSNFRNRIIEENIPDKPFDFCQ